MIRRYQRWIKVFAASKLTSMGNTMGNVITYFTGRNQASALTEEEELNNNLRITVPSEQNDTWLYKMNHSRRGLGIIFKYDARDDTAEADCSTLKKTLEELNFNVIVHNDLTYEDLKIAMDEISEHNFKNSDCLFIAVLSRGKGNYIDAKNVKYSIDIFFERFTIDRCPTLARKPKMFFFHCYHDNDCADGADEHVTDNSIHKVNRIPLRADFLTVYSTVPGNYSWQNPQEGSLFIQTFCDEISKNWQNVDLVSMLTFVKGRVKAHLASNELPARHEQIPCITSALTGLIRFGLVNEAQGVTIPSEKYDSFYEMNQEKSNEKRGLAIIFDQENFSSLDLVSRSGTKADCEKLKDTLELLHFEVIVYHDLTFKQLKHEIYEISQRDFTNCDCFFMVVLSHGEQNNFLHAKDEKYRIHILFDPFTPDKCPNLAGKPKIFIIQACRGDLLDNGADVKVENVQCPSDQTGYSTSIAEEKVNDAHLSSITEEESLDCSLDYHNKQLPADFLVAYSSMPGYSSWRSVENGSWFVQTVCQEITKYWLDFDLVTILTSVNKRLALEFESKMPSDQSKDKKRQISCITSKLTKLVKFKMENKECNME